MTFDRFGLPTCSAVFSSSRALRPVDDLVARICMALGVWPLPDTPELIEHALVPRIQELVRKFGPVTQSPVSASRAVTPDLTKTNLVKDMERRAAEREAAIKRARR